MFVASCELQPPHLAEDSTDKFWFNIFSRFDRWTCILGDRIIGNERKNKKYLKL